MAISRNNIILAELSGTIGQQLCFKNYSGKTVVTKRPDMSKVVASENQLKEKGRFGEAIRYARGILRDPAKKAAYKADDKSTVYHTAIRNFLAGKV